MIHKKTSTDSTGKAQYVVLLDKILVRRALFTLESDTEP